MKVSATIITRNEERALPKCVQNIRDVVEEIIIVDSGSTDHTVAIAQQLGLRVTYHPFSDFSSQKNYAASLAQNDWILNIDADELLSDELKEWIRKIKTYPESSIRAYCFPRKTYGPDGKMLFNIVSYPGFHYRLYDRRYCRWRNPVHETLEVQGRRKFCPRHLLHYPNYDIVPEKEQLYNRLKQQTSGESYPFSILKLLGNFWFHFRALFIDLQFYKKGWIYWKHGLHILFHLAGLRLQKRRS